jgi:hypothetical protein
VFKNMEVFKQAGLIVLLNLPIITGNIRFAFYGFHKIQDMKRS